MWNLLSAITIMMGAVLVDAVEVPSSAPAVMKTINQQCPDITWMSSEESNTWIQKEFLGRGMFGAAYRVVQKVNESMEAAMKVLNLSSPMIDIPSIANEVCIMHLIQSPSPASSIPASESLAGKMGSSPQGEHHVVRLRGIYLDVSLPSTPLFKIYMDLYNGTISDGLNRYDNQNPTSRSWAKWILADLALGMKHIHDHGILHNDIKNPNILLSKEDGHAVFADFGSAMKDTGNEQDGDENQRGSKPRDIKALSQIFLSVLTRVEGIQNVSSTIHDIKDAKAKDLVEKMSHTEKTKRITADELVNHPYFSKE